MKKVHLIHSKNLDDTQYRYRGKVLPLLEKEVLQWAEFNQQSAYQQTLVIKKELGANQSLENKYFRYLRRLLELKLETQENLCDAKNEESPKLNQDLIDCLNIESLRVPHHLSCSQQSLYKSCKRKYYYSYLLGIKLPPTHQLRFGTAVDLALNYIFENKAKELPFDRKIAYQIFDDTFIDDSELVDWGDIDKEKLRAQGPSVIDAYLDAFEANTHPVAVQKEIEIKLDNNGLLVGAIDILAKDDVIIDTKTAKEPWKPRKEFSEAQPKAYSLWHFLQFGRLPSLFRYQIVCKDETKNDEKPRTQLINLKVTQAEVDKFKQDIQEMWDDILKAIYIGKTAFPAEAEKNWVSPLCTKQWCPYWKNCEADGLKISDYWSKELKRHVYLQPQGKESLF